MKHVFLPFGLDGVDKAPLEVAAHLAEHYDGRAIAMFYPRPVESPLVDPMGVGIIDYADQGPDLAREADTALATMRARIQGLGAGAERVMLHDQPLKARFGIGEQARLFDLTVVGKAEETDWRAVFETALFEGGRPVMLVPTGWTRPSGDTVGVAWNRSTETARLIGQSLPVLRAAKRAVVIEIEGWAMPGPDGTALVNYLKLHGVAAESGTGAAIDARPRAGRSRPGRGGRHRPAAEGRLHPEPAEADDLRRRHQRHHCRRHHAGRVRALTTEIPDERQRVRYRRYWRPQT